MNPLDIKDVEQCKLCVNLSTDYVPSLGNPTANLMLIGQSPGKREVELGRPFVGPAGELLDFMLLEAGIDRDRDCYIANILKCRPPGNRPSVPAERANCWRQWLHDEIRIVNPRFVLLLGKEAHTTVLAKVLEKNPFGHKLVYQSKLRTYITSYHPAYFLRQQDFSEFLSVGPFLQEVMEAVNDKQEKIP